ncbi:TPA: LPXTG cell wall anchor domain-containing protein, partial [Streptococcus agalactiae]
EETRKAEEARKAEETRKAEEAHKAEEARKAEETRKAEEGHKTQEAPIVEEGYKVNNVHQTDTTVKASDLPKTKTVSAVHMARTDNKQITSHQTRVEKQIKNTLPSTGDSKRGYYIAGMAIVMLSVLFSLAKKFKSKY